MMRHLILGAVEKYQFSAVRNFIHSLRKTSFNEKIILFTNQLSEETISKIESYGILTIPYERPENCVIHNYRFFLYKDFLDVHSKDYSVILLTDVRDVLFQDNPFTESSTLNCINTFFEEKRIKIVESKEYNAKWVRDALGVEALNEIGENYIVNAGTILGPSNKIQDYLNLFSKLFNWTNSHLPLDQGIINYICHKKLLENISIIDNNSGIVCTMGHMKTFPFDYPFVKRNDGRTVSILHQYDRHKFLNSHFANYYAS